MQIDEIKLFEPPYDKRIAWKEIPDEHNYENAYEYLSLVALPKRAQFLTDRLRDTELVLYRRPDTIMRAAGLNMLQQTDIRVQNAIRKIHSNIELAPALIVTSRRNDRIHIADGYHRICAAYYYAESIKVPCVATAWEMD